MRNAQYNEYTPGNVDAESKVCQAFFHGGHRTTYRAQTHFKLRK